MPYTTYGAQGVNNYIFGKTSVFDTQPTIWVGLSTADPTADASGNAEPSGGGYARVQTSASDWSTSTSAHPSVISNAAAIDFGTASGAWSGGDDMAYFTLWDSDAGSPDTSNMIGYAALTTAKPVASGDPVAFAIGDLTWSQS